MGISFSLKAVPDYKGRLMVKDYYRFTVGQPVVDEQGRTRYATDLSGVVDEAIQKQHPKEWADWRAYVDANDEQLYAEARAAYQRDK